MGLAAHHSRSKASSWQEQVLCGWQAGGPRQPPSRHRKKAPTAPSVVRVQALPCHYSHPPRWRHLEGKEESAGINALPLPASVPQTRKEKTAQHQDLSERTTPPNSCGDQRKVGLGLPPRKGFASAGGCIHPELGTGAFSRMPGLLPIPPLPGSRESAGAGRRWGNTIPVHKAQEWSSAETVHWLHLTPSSHGHPRDLALQILGPAQKSHTHAADCHWGRGELRPTLGRRRQVPPSSSAGLSTLRLPLKPAPHRVLGAGDWSRSQLTETAAKQAPPSPPLAPHQ